MRSILMPIIFLFSLIGYAQDSEERLVVPTMNFGFHANLKDFYVDLGGGAEETSTRIGAQLNFAWRPFYKKVQIHESANVIRQWREKKFFISLDVYKRLLRFGMGPKTEAHFILGAKTGYLFGDYKGTKQRPEAGITINPFGGVGFDLNGAYVAVQMLVFNDKLDSVQNQRLMVSLNLPLK